MSQQCEVVLEKTGEQCQHLAVTGQKYCWQHSRIDGENPSVSVRCLAISAKTGEQCQLNAVNEGQYCWQHGGIGKESQVVVLKSGKYSRLLPMRLAATYKEMLEDDEWLSLKADNALLSTRIEELIGKIDLGDSMTRWQKMSKAYNDMVNASYEGKVQDARVAMENLGKLVNDGLSDSYTWKEIFQVLEQRRRLVETQRKLDQDKGRNISVDRAMIWVGAIMDSLTRNITARLSPEDAQQVLRDISRDLEQLLYMEPEPRKGSNGEYTGVVDARGLPTGRNW